MSGKMRSVSLSENKTSPSLKKTTKTVIGVALVSSFLLVVAFAAHN
jgi:hypothetical protein